MKWRESKVIKFLVAKKTLDRTIAIGAILGALFAGWAAFEADLARRDVREMSETDERPYVNINKGHAIIGLSNDSNEGYGHYGVIFMDIIASGRTPALHVKTRSVCSLYEFAPKEFPKLLDSSFVKELSAVITPGEKAQFKCRTNKLVTAYEIRIIVEISYDDLFAHNHITELCFRGNEIGLLKESDNVELESCPNYPIKIS